MQENLGEQCFGAKEGENPEEHRNRFPVRLRHSEAPELPPGCYGLFRVGILWTYCSRLTARPLPLIAIVRRTDNSFQEKVTMASIDALAYSSPTSERRRPWTRAIISRSTAGRFMLRELLISCRLLKQLRLPSTRCWNCSAKRWVFFCATSGRGSGRGGWTLCAQQGRPPAR